MKILVWNIQQGGGSRKSRIADRIKSHDPDVIVLIEFAANKADSFQFLEPIRARLGASIHWMPNRDE